MDINAQFSEINKKLDSLKAELVSFKKDYLDKDFVGLMVALTQATANINTMIALKNNEKMTESIRSPIDPPQKIEELNVQLSKTHSEKSTKKYKNNMGYFKDIFSKNPDQVIADFGIDPSCIACAKEKYPDFAKKATEDEQLKFIAGKIWTMKEPKCFITQEMKDGMRDIVAKTSDNISSEAPAEVAEANE